MESSKQSKISALIILVFLAAGVVLLIKGLHTWGIGLLICVSISSAMWIIPSRTTKNRLKASKNAAPPTVEDMQIYRRKHPEKNFSEAVADLKESRTVK